MIALIVLGASILGTPRPSSRGRSSSGEIVWQLSPFMLIVP